MYEFDYKNLPDHPGFILLVMVIAVLLGLSLA
jgi:hypothetical protein